MLPALREDQFVDPLPHLAGNIHEEKRMFDHKPFSLS